MTLIKQKKNQIIEIPWDSNAHFYTSKFQAIRFSIVIEQEQVIFLSKQVNIALFNSSVKAIIAHHDWSFFLNNFIKDVTATDIEKFKF